MSWNDPYAGQGVVIVDNPSYLPYDEREALYRHNHEANGGTAPVPDGGWGSSYMTGGGGDDGGGGGGGGAAGSSGGAAGTSGGAGGYTNPWGAIGGMGGGTITDPNLRLFSGDDPRQSMRVGMGGKYNFMGGSPAAAFMEAIANPLYIQYVLSRANEGRNFGDASGFAQGYKDYFNNPATMGFNRDQLASLAALGDEAIGSGGNGDPRYGIGKWLTSAQGAQQGMLAANYFNTPGGAFRDAYASYLGDRVNQLKDKEAPPDNFLKALLG